MADVPSPIEAASQVKPVSVGSAVGGGGTGGAEGTGVCGEVEAGGAREAEAAGGGAMLGTTEPGTLDAAPDGEARAVERRGEGLASVARPASPPPMMAHVARPTSPTASSTPMTEVSGFPWRPASARRVVTPSTGSVGRPRGVPHQRQNPADALLAAPHSAQRTSPVR